MQHISYTSMSQHWKYNTLLHIPVHPNTENTSYASGSCHWENNTSYTSVSWHWKYTTKYNYTTRDTNISRNPITWDNDALHNSPDHTACRPAWGDGCRPPGTQRWSAAGTSTGTRTGQGHAPVMCPSSGSMTSSCCEPAGSCLPVGTEQVCSTHWLWHMDQ